MTERKELGWLGTTMLITWPILLIITIVCATNNHKAKEVEKKENIKKVSPFARYFLVDEFRCLHESDCFQLKYAEDGLHRVQFIKKEDLKKSSLDWYCPSCISVEVYEAIQKYRRGGEAL